MSVMLTNGSKLMLLRSRRKNERYECESPDKEVGPPAGPLRR